MIRKFGDILGGGHRSGFCKSSLKQGFGSLCLLLQACCLEKGSKVSRTQQGKALSMKVDLAGIWLRVHATESTVRTCPE